jgi:hypothetical protein
MGLREACWDQGCQIFLAETNQNWLNVPNCQQQIPNILKRYKSGNKKQVAMKLHQKISSAAPP